MTNPESSEITGLLYFLEKYFAFIKALSKKEGPRGKSAYVSYLSQDKRIYIAVNTLMQQIFKIKKPINKGRCVLVNKDGNLMLVGSYGSNSNSFDNNCLVGVCDTNTGAFNLLKTYNLGFRELFFKIYESTFGRLDERDKQFLASMINYLHKNNMIHARSLMSRLWKTTKNYLLKHNGVSNLKLS